MWPRWKSPMYMPKEAARIWLKIVSLDMERLLDITEEEAIAEGFEEYDTHSYIPGEAVMQIEDTITAREQYLALFERINGKGMVEQNPWVIVVGFEVVEKPYSMTRENERQPTAADWEKGTLPF